MRVFLTGATGLVGSRLTPVLLKRGDQPVVLTRRYAHARQALGPQTELVEGDPSQPGPWMDAVVGCDAVVHLAGENIFGHRWNAEFKQRLADSRILGTRNVAQAILRRPKRADGQPKVLVSASAIGYYGPHGDEEVSEDAPPGNDFLARLCVDWEQAARDVEPAGVRCAVVRVGVVLDRNGGALVALLPPFKMFVGGPVASGRQWMSWIHHEDMTGALLLALDHLEGGGPFNATAPNPVTNRDFSKALGRALHRPAFVWTPGFALRALLGEVAGIVTTGQRVLPHHALALGYAFKYPTIEAALAQLFAG
jgi:uncharacterized protein (TIGR01777 family)